MVSVDEQAETVSMTVAAHPLKAMRTEEPENEDPFLAKHVREGYKVRKKTTVVECLSSRQFYAKAVQKWLLQSFLEMDEARGQRKRPAVADTAVLRPSSLPHDTGFQEPA
jgi:hypothetical protein